MKRFYFLSATIMAVFLTSCIIGCSSDEDEQNSIDEPSSDKSVSLAGKKYSGFDDYNQEHSFTFGDADFQKMSSAIYFVPKDKYESSWNYADTLLTTYEMTTKQLILSFESSTKATLIDYTQSNVVQQKAEVYHHYYRFKEDFYTENSLYMVNITSSSFSVYDKTASKRYDFRLDGNYGYNLTFYMKKGGTKQDVLTNTDNYEYLYKYDENLSRVDFTDAKGNTAYGFIAERHNAPDNIEHGFSLYLNDKVYFLKE